MQAKTGNVQHIVRTVERGWAATSHAAPKDRLATANTHGSMVAECSGFGFTSRLGAYLANGAAHTDGLAVNLFFDAYKAPMSDGFGCDGNEWIAWRLLLSSQG